MSWQERYQQALMNNFGTPQALLVRGEGARVWDSEGNEYLDLLGGIAVNALGHGHPAIISAVTEQLNTLGHVSNLFASEPQLRLAERLLDLVGSPGRVFFANSGAEVNEAAFKLTRLTGRTRVVAAEGSFHGRTMGALALTSKSAYRAPFEPLPGEVAFVPYGDSDALAEAVDERTAAILLEPIQGEAGVIVPAGDYLATARRIADEHGALLWLDEIQTGIGRTGHWFAHRREGTDPVVPDLITLAKGLGGGIPIGACVALGSAGELFEPGHHGTTFGGNPLACAAALAVLDTIETADLMGNAQVRGAELAAALRTTVGPVSGAGLLLGVQLERALGLAMVSAARSAGFLINATGPDRLRLAPPLVLTADDVQRFAQALPGILDTATKEVVP